MPLSSGLGSSAASAVAATLATSAIYGGQLSQNDLLECAIAGESLASGAVHADNVAPSFLGGFVLVRSLEPVPDIVSLPVPAGLSVALVRPQLEIDTAPARRALATELPLPIAVAQWANVGALVAALCRGDLELLGRSLCDFVAEPVRSPLVPGFDAARNAALDAGAIGCSLSGSGPTMFALCASHSIAAEVVRAMASRLEAATGSACDVWVSAVGAQGAREWNEPDESPESNDGFPASAALVESAGARSAEE
jgi:homoserine kinase